VLFKGLRPDTLVFMLSTLRSSQVAKRHGSIQFAALNGWSEIVSHVEVNTFWFGTGKR
jgi:hypothetical protein